MGVWVIGVITGIGNWGVGANSRLFRVETLVGCRVIGQWSGHNAGKFGLGGVEDGL